jgi:hypothetical protein
MRRRHGLRNNVVIDVRNAKERLSETRCRSSKREGEG